MNVRTAEGLPQKKRRAGWLTARKASSPIDKARLTLRLQVIHQPNVMIKRKACRNDRRIST
jgi:hypothetical protein